MRVLAALPLIAAIAYADQIGDHFRAAHEALVAGGRTTVSLRAFETIARTSLSSRVTSAGDDNDGASADDQDAAAEEEEESFQALLRHEAALRSNADGNNDDAPTLHVVCGPLSDAKRARAALAGVTPPRGGAGHGAEDGDVLYTSKRHDAACWSVKLRPSDARTLPPIFLHVMKHPAPGKFAGALLGRASGDDTLRLRPMALENGALVQLEERRDAVAAQVSMPRSAGTALLCSPHERIMGSSGGDRSWRGNHGRL